MQIETNPWVLEKKQKHQAKISRAKHIWHWFVQN